MLFRWSIRLPTTLVLVVLLTSVLFIPSEMTALSQGTDEGWQQYIVYDVRNRYQRTEIARTGAAIDAVGSDWVEIRPSRRK